MKLYLYREGGDRLPDVSWRKRLFLNCAADFTRYGGGAKTEVFASEISIHNNLESDIIPEAYNIESEKVNFNINCGVRGAEPASMDFEIYGGMQCDENAGADFELRYGAHGKPYFAKPPLAGEVFFSISHSGGYWAVLFFDSEVGFDMEDISLRTSMSEERMAKIAKRFFTEDEQRYVFDRTNANGEQCHETESADADLTYSHVAACAGASYEHDHTGLNSDMSRDDTLRRFFRIWTAKEAYIKYTGNGLSEGLQSFSAIAPPLGVVITTYAPYPDIIYSYCRASAAMGDSNFIAMELTDSIAMQDVAIRTVSDMD